MLDRISQRFPDSALPAPQFEIQNIIETINDMDPSKALGPDGIGLGHIKDAAEQLAPILKNIFDKVALHARMPLQWKTAKIFGSPKIKGCYSQNPSDYRPISLLCWIGKIFEKCLYVERKVWYFSYLRVSICI